MLAKVYVITANTDPEDWYRRADVHRNDHEAYYRLCSR